MQTGILPATGSSLGPILPIERALKARKQSERKRLMVQANWGNVALRLGKKSVGHERIVFWKSVSGEVLTQRSVESFLAQLNVSRVRIYSLFMAEFKERVCIERAWFHL